MVSSIAGTESKSSLDVRADDLAVVSNGVRGSLEGLLRCDLLHAIDRPSVLELELVAPDPGLPRASRSAAREYARRPDFRADSPLRVLLRDKEIFRGITERVAFDADGHATPRVVVTACEAYHFLRECIAGTTYHRVTLEELAWDIAVRLGLRPRIALERDSATTFDSVTIEDDPLATLRGIANARGLHLSVFSGVLALGDWPDARRSHLVSSGDALGSVRIEQGRGGVISGALRVVGDHPARPLDVIVVRGFGDPCDGTYRVRRARLHLTPDGRETELELSTAGSSRHGGGPS